MSLFATPDFSIGKGSGSYPTSGPPGTLAFELTDPAVNSTSTFGHVAFTDWVFSVAFNPAGTHIAATGGLHQLKIWRPFAGWDVPSIDCNGMLLQMGVVVRCVSASLVLPACLV